MIEFEIEIEKAQHRQAQGTNRLLRFAKGKTTPDKQNGSRPHCA